MLSLDCGAAMPPDAPAARGALNASTANLTNCIFRPQYWCSRGLYFSAGGCQTIPFRSGVIPFAQAVTILKIDLPDLPFSGAWMPPRVGATGTRRDRSSAGPCVRRLVVAVQFQAGQRL